MTDKERQIQMDKEKQYYDETLNTQELMTRVLFVYASPSGKVKCLNHRNARREDPVLKGLG